MLQNVLITIAGANPQTKLVQVNVDPTTGEGSGNFSYQGVNSGTDTITAFAEVDGSSEVPGSVPGTVVVTMWNSVTSNVAQVNWQQSNGHVQVGSAVTASMWNDSSGSGSTGVYPKFNASDPGYSSSTTSDKSVLSMSSGFVASVVGNSLLFDYVTPGSNNDVQWATLNAAGTVTGSSTPFPGTDANFNLIVTAQLLVPDTNPHTISMLNLNDAILGLGGGLIFSHGSYAGGQTMTAMNGYPLLLGDHSSSGTSSSSGSGTFTAPAPGVYDIEIGWDYWYHSGRTMQVTIDGAVVAPVALVAAPPTTPATGNLTLTPSGGAPNLVIQGQTITLTVSLNGVTFTTTPYLPLLENTPGVVSISNVPSSANFHFPTLPQGGSVDLTAAVGVFSLDGDNSAWQNLCSIAPVSGGYQLQYNGGAVVPNVAVTNLTITEQDIAWFDTADNAIDLYSVTSAGGGVKVTVPVYWLVSPAAPSVTPTTLTANDTQQTLTVTLTKPLPPIQKNVLVTFTATSGLTINETIPVFNSQGFLTGWTLLVTPPSVDGTSTLSLTATDTQTYLSSSGITTGTLSYFNNTAIATIILGEDLGGGGGSSVPSLIGWNVAYDSGTEMLTLTATVQCAVNDFLNGQFFEDIYATDGAPDGLTPYSTPQTPVVTETSGVWTAVYTLLISAPYFAVTYTDENGPQHMQAMFGFSETGSDGYTVSHSDPSVYSYA